MGHFSTELDAYGCMNSFMLLTFSFLCSVFIISQVSATMATTITPPVTIVCSIMSYLLKTVTITPSLMGILATSGQQDVVVPPQLILRNSGGVVGFATMLQQQPQSQMSLLAYANYGMDLLQVGFSFRVEPHSIFICVGVSYGVLSTFRCHAGCCIHLFGLNHWGLPFGAYLWQAYVQPVIDIVPHQ